VCIFHAAYPSGHTMLRFIGRIEHFSQWRQIALTNKPSFCFILLGQQWNVTFWFQILNIVYSNFWHVLNFIYVFYFFIYLFVFGSAEIKHHFSWRFFKGLCSKVNKILKIICYFKENYFEVEPCFTN